MRSPGRSPTVRGKRAFDRQSGSGRSGLPKKNGAGAKTVWGDAKDQRPVAYLDKKDPNYDSSEEDGLPPLELNEKKVEKTESHAPVKEGNAENKEQVSAPSNDVEATSG